MIFCVLLVGAVLSIATSATAQDFADRANALLTTYHDHGLFNGAVLVGDGDDVVYARGFGEADISWHAPNSPDTKFRIASVTKQFTAALVLQLVEEGLVDLNAPVTAYLPDYPTAQGDRVTVHHLLTQTSGIPNYTILPAWPEIKRDRYAPDSFLAVFSRLDLEFEPGSRFSYSNSNYFLLGVIIEHVTGQAFPVALRERLLAPLGLDDTGYDARKDVVERMARGYDWGVDGYEPESYIDVSLPYAAGMMYSTVGDLFRWKRALHRGTPFREAGTLERMLTPHGGSDYGYAYGLGVNFRAFGADSALVVGHGGRIEAFNSDDRYLPNEGWTVIVLSNTGSDVAAVSVDLIRLLFGQSVEAPDRPALRR